MRRANLRRMKAPTTVARLTCDEPTARRLAAYLGERLDAEDTACAAFEGDDGRWHVAIHFRGAPDEIGLRELVKLAAGTAAADALTIEPVADSDWVAQSLAGLWPVRAGRLVVHGAHARGGLRANDIGIQIEAALAFGTGHHGTTLGCLLALDDLAKRRKARRVLDVGTGTGAVGLRAGGCVGTLSRATRLQPGRGRAGPGNAPPPPPPLVYPFWGGGGAGPQVNRGGPPKIFFLSQFPDAPPTRAGRPVGQ